MLNDQRHTQFIVWTMLCLMPILGMAVDLVTPSLPAIANNWSMIHTPKQISTS